MAPLQLGIREKPARVTCDTGDRCHYRCVYVQLNEAQCCQIEEMEAKELHRLNPIQNTEKASN